MLIGEYRMIDGLQDDHFVKPLYHLVNTMIKLQMEGGGGVRAVSSVMNTMLMSVFERTVEIGVLRAIGWRAARIRKMILLEATLLGVAGGILGVLLGFLARELLYLLPTIGGTIRIEIGVDAVLSTIFFATVVGALSGLYPAIRASRMNPTVAFRHQ